MKTASVSTCLQARRQKKVVRLGMISHSTFSGSSGTQQERNLGAPVANTDGAHTPRACESADGRRKCQVDVIDHANQQPEGDYLLNIVTRVRVSDTYRMREG